MLFTGEWFTDNFIMSNILSEVEYYSGTERKKILKVSKGNGSMLYGTTWRSYLSPGKSRTPSPWKNLYYTKAHDDNPHLEKIFKEFANLYFKDFDYDQVQMNKNYAIPRHIDSKNVGESVLVAFGDYENGGLTIVEYEDKIIAHDPRDGPVKFDGSKYYHRVTKHSNGDRYSLVFFKNNKKVLIE